MTAVPIKVKEVLNACAMSSEDETDASNDDDYEDDWCCCSRCAYEFPAGVKGFLYHDKDAQIEYIVCSDCDAELKCYDELISRSRGQT